MLLTPVKRSRESEHRMSHRGPSPTASQLSLIIKIPNLQTPKGGCQDSSRLFGVLHACSD